MGALTFCLCVFIGCMLVTIEAQNGTLPTNILNTMKTSVEAAGAGGLKLGPMGLFGDMNGQFGVKVNKESSSTNTASLTKKITRGNQAPLLGERVSKLKKLDKEGSLSKNNTKNCYGRYGSYGRPIIIPIIVSTTAATTTTTAAAN